ncbi:hypothetical protein OG407_24025 [Streptomyces sp. NBC_01515]|uniref:hypothetical protein n=1 Tax=Streptomyces sp. NBC_01515 TaxID=2903890 RepID=UPI003867D757
MAAELIRYNQGRVSMHPAVGHIAAALSPLSAAATIVSQIGACVVEISRFRLDAQYIAGQRAVSLEIVKARQNAIVLLFEAEKRASAQTNVDRRGLMAGYHQMIANSCNMRVSQEERMLALGIVPVLSEHIVQDRAKSGDDLVRLSDSLRLGQTEIAVAAWRALER